MSIYERGSHRDGVIASAVQIHLNGLRLVKGTNFVTWVSHLICNQKSQKILISKP